MSQLDLPDRNASPDADTCNRAEQRQDAPWRRQRCSWHPDYEHDDEEGLCLHPDYYEVD